MRPREGLGAGRQTGSKRGHWAESKGWGPLKLFCALPALGGPSEAKPRVHPVEARSRPPRPQPRAAPAPTGPSWLLPFLHPPSRPQHWAQQGYLQFLQQALEQRVEAVTLELTQVAQEALGCLPVLLYERPGRPGRQGGQASPPSLQPIPREPAGPGRVSLNHLPTLEPSWVPRVPVPCGSESKSPGPQSPGGTQLLIAPQHTPRPHPLLAGGLALPRTLQCDPRPMGRHSRCGPLPGLLGG